MGNSNVSAAGDAVDKLVQAVGGKINGSSDFDVWHGAAVNILGLQARGISEILSVFARALSRAFASHACDKGVICHHHHGGCRVLCFRHRRGRHGT